MTLHRMINAFILLCLQQIVVPDGSLTQNVAGYDSHGLRSGTSAHVIDIPNASAKVLLEELLSEKALDRKVVIKADNRGLIRGGELYDLHLLKTTVSNVTKLEPVGIFPWGKTRFVVHGIHAEVLAKYRLLLTGFEVVQSGNVSASLYASEGGGMTISIPDQGFGRGGCAFSRSLDLKIHNTTSGYRLEDMTITKALQDNVFWVRSEIVSEMEDGLCRALLEPKRDRRQAKSGNNSEEVTVNEMLTVAKRELPKGAALSLEIGLLASVISLCVGFWSGFCVRGCCSKTQIVDSRTYNYKSESDSEGDNGSLC